MKKVVFFLGGIVLAGSVLWHANRVILSYDAQIVDTVAEAATTTVAIAFGGGMKDAHTMSDMQEDRMARAVALYDAGKAGKLLLTGDDGARYFDEVGTMKAYALAHGVPAEDILADPHGYNTFESCRRAKAEFGVEKAVAISQSFHLPRIRYFCTHAGIDTAGLSADLREYDDWWAPGLREILARVKGWARIELLQK